MHAALSMGYPGPGFNPAVITRAQQNVTDTFHIAPDGAIISWDGFCVPRSFAEFNERFPDHVRRFAAARDKYDREDLVSDLNLYLMTAPPPGRFFGCQDRCQTFDPQRADGATESRFLGYINEILTNHFLTLTRKKKITPLGHPRTVSM